MDNKSADVAVPKFGARHMMTSLMFTYLTCAFLTQSALSLAIVAMTDSAASPNPDVPTYEWNNTGTLLSSFFWTYTALQPFSGYIIIHLGLKWVLLVTMTVNCGAFMLIPVATFRFGSSGLMACRLVQGLCQGFVYPAVHTAIGTWVPANERSLLTMVMNLGINTGSIIAMLATGYLSASWWGWPQVYYILGTVCVIWCVIWWALAADSPATHATITEGERLYIENSLETTKDEVHSTIPLKAILTSLPFWSIVVANVGYTWGWTIIETELPTYLSYVLDFDITSNGVATSLPLVMQLLITIPLGPLGDYLVSRKLLSLWTWRRLLQALGSVIPCVALIWLAYISKGQHTLALVLLNVAIGTNAVYLYGSLINHVDLSPKYAGVLISIENTISQAISMFGPVFIQYVVTDLADIVLWRSIFLSLSGVMIVTATFFIVFGTADIQWWNSKSSR